MLRDRLTPLVSRLGVDKVGQPLRFCEVDLAVAKSASSKFAGLGEPQPEGGERIKDPGHYRPPAVDMKLDHVFAREAGRPRKPEHDGLVKNLGRRRMTQPPEAGDPSRRHPAVTERIEPFRAALPEIRMTAMPARPGGVERA